MRFTLMALATLFSVSGVYAQKTGVYAPGNADSSIAKVINVYREFRGSQAAIYTGIDYIPFQYKLDEGNEIYRFYGLTPGTVSYEGGVYSGELLYDLVQQQLVIRNPFNGSRIQLYGERVEAFTIAGHKFISLINLPGLPESGFYEIIQDGRATLLARRKKTILEKIQDGKTTRTIVENNLYYVLNDNKAMIVSNKRNLEKAIPDTALRRYNDDNKPDFKHNLEAALAQVIRYYNNLP